MTEKSTGPHHFTMPAWISTAPFENLLNMTIAEAADGQATLTMPFYPEFCNGAGIMHGGALVSLADTAVVMAIKTLLPQGSHFATTDATVKFLHPVKQGMITARGRVVSRTERVIEGEAIVYDQEERAMMEFRSTFKVSRSPLEGITFADSETPG